MGCLTHFILSVPFLVALAAAAFQYAPHLVPSLNGMLPALVVERNFNASSIPSLKGKVALVTGCNSGLGLETAKALAKNGAKVFMSCRTLAKCEGAAKTIRESAPDASLALIFADLGDLMSVQAAANQVLSETDKLDILVLNAATALGEFVLSEQNLELQFAVNHVAHFYLTAKLTPLLRKSPFATVSVVSSIAGAFSFKQSYPLNLLLPSLPPPVPVTEKQVNFADLNKYNNGHAYCRSKLANLLFAREFAEKEKKNGILCNAVHPGAVTTAFLKEVRAGVKKMDSPFFLWLHELSIKVCDMLFFTAEDAALTQLYTAVSPEIMNNEVTGKLFFPVGQHMAAERLLPADFDLDVEQKKLWAFTEELLKNRGFTDY